MRKGNQPRILLNSKGEMFAMATGTDHTAEHEFGSNPLLETLTGSYGQSAEAIANWLRVEDSSWPTRVQTPAGAAELAAAVPERIAEKRIKHELGELRYEARTVAGEPEAALTFNAYGRAERPFELRFSMSGEPRDIVGAWDERSFGFKVRGENNAERLHAFSGALKAGRGVFAGTFLKSDGDAYLSGVIIAIEDMLRPEHKAAIKVLQARHVSNVELHLRSRLPELLELNSKLKRQMTAVWPVWHEVVTGMEVTYAVNPSFSSKLRYTGPYEFDDLKAWLAAGAPDSALPRLAA